MDDNIHNLRDALEWIDRRIREEAEYDGEMSNEHAIQLGFITNMLEKFPLRQCDVGTAEEQAVRFRDMCNKYYDDENPCNKKCPLASLSIIHGFPRCQAYWAQTPYEEGGAE